jgi:3-methyladenine DNA glycosylase/8-oxoguanine DNA glycosylase
MPMSAGEEVPAIQSCGRATLRLPRDFEPSWLLGFLRPRAIAGVERVTSDAYVRTIRLGERVHTTRLTFAPDLIRLETVPRPQPAEVQRLFRRMLELDADLSAFRSMTSGDDILGPLVGATPGVRLIRFPDPFEGLVRAILGQQVSLAAAATTASRIATRFGTVAPKFGEPFRAFPSPEALARATDAELRATGLTGAKSTALSLAARAVVARTIDFEQLASAPSEEADAALRALTGVGSWTAAYVRMRGLGDRDAFPASDLGVLKALGRLLGKSSVSAREAEALSERWRPWRAYATLYLWQSLSQSSTVNSRQ